MFRLDKTGMAILIVTATHVRPIHKGEALTDLKSIKIIAPIIH